MRLFKFLNLFSTDLGIDLGTANTLVAVRGRGIVISEPSYVTIRKGTNKIFRQGDRVAIGSEAKRMGGRGNKDLQIIRPLKDGVIADYEITSAMLQYFIKKAHPWGLKPRVTIAVPSGITQVEMNAVIQATQQAGAREVFLIEEPMAAAIGVGMPVTEPVANLVVDIGGGTTEVAVISLGNSVTSHSLRVAGDAFDTAITDWLKTEHGLIIGPQWAENIKVEIGSAYPLEEERTMEVRGSDEQMRMPRGTTVSSKEIREALTEPVMEIIGAIRLVLERTPPELAADLIDAGMVLAGGGALLRGLDKVICRHTGLPVKLADDPLMGVAFGTAKVLEDVDMYNDALKSGREAA